MILDSEELGIFISLLSHNYIKKHIITKEEFLNSLSHSLDKLDNSNAKET